ncbi:MAG: hypothetical protein AAF763_15950, partial [Pseudomonadota bacterium]
MPRIVPPEQGAAVPATWRREARFGGPFDWRYALRRTGWVRWVTAPWPEAGVVFLLNGKCGNSSVRTGVLEARGLDVRRPHKATEPWSLRRCAGSGLRLIGVCRNPYARAASLWNGKLRRRPEAGLRRKGGFRGDEGFVEFLRGLERMDDWADLHARAQWKGMVWGGRWLPERVVRLEDPAGWEALREALPGLGPLPVRNASGTEDWRVLCEGEAGEIVRRRWARDFEAFGYEA